MRYCLFLIVFISAAVFASPEKFALIIGNNTGLSEDPPLKYAAADAQKVYKVLTDIGKINSDRAYLMLNKSVSEIRGIFRETLGRTKEISLSGGDSYVMIYYSGHGSREALHIRGERLLISDVKEYFSEMKAKVKLLVADACYSGSLISEKGGTVSGPTEVKFFDNMEVEGSAVITSCSPGELSHESGDLKGSLFTHYFVSALRGAADFNGDKKVSLWESYSFARQHTARKGMNVKNFSQTPLYEFRIKGRNDLTVTDLNTSKSLLMFHDLPEDRYSILEEMSGSPEAEVFMREGDSVTLCLPSGIYTVRNIRKDRVLLAKTDINWGGHYVLDRSKMKGYPLEALNTKGIPSVRYKPFFTEYFYRNMSYFPSPEIRAGIHGVNLTFSSYNWAAGISAGYGNSPISGVIHNVERKIWSASIRAEYYLLKKIRYRAFGGLSYGMDILNQKLVRKDEEALKSAGYEKAETVYTVINNLSLPAGAVFYLPYSFSVSARLIPGVYFFNDESGSVKTGLRIPFEVSAGFRF